MREERTNRTIAAIEQAQAELRESIAESDRLAARADALLTGSRRRIGGLGGAAGGGEGAQA